MVNSTVTVEAKRFSILPDAAYRKDFNLDQGFDVARKIEDYGFELLNIEERNSLGSIIDVSYRDGSADTQLRRSADDVHYYNEDTGFSAYVVRDPITGKAVITFRGTDTTLNILGAQIEAIFQDQNPENDDFDPNFANRALGSFQIMNEVYA